MKTVEQRLQELADLNDTDHHEVMIERRGEVGLLLALKAIKNICRSSDVAFRQVAETVRAYEAGSFEVATMLLLDRGEGPVDKVGAAQTVADWEVKHPPMVPTDEPRHHMSWSGHSVAGSFAEVAEALERGFTPREDAVGLATKLGFSIVGVGSYQVNHRRTPELVKVAPPYDQVTAIQATKNNELAMGLFAGPQYVDRMSRGGVAVKLKSGMLHAVFAGDWLVRNKASGELDVLSAEQFARIFIAGDLPEPASSPGVVG